MASFQNGANHTDPLTEEVVFADLSVAERMQLLRNAVIFPSGNLETSVGFSHRPKALLQELETHSDLAFVQEQPFVSNVPFLGKIIVRLRYAWNWMSTKWYVQPLVEQQNTFNEWVMRLLREIVLLLRSLQDKASTEGQRDSLADEVVQLQQEVQELRAQVITLQAHLLATEDTGAVEEL